MPEYRHIANLGGPRGLDASEIPGLSYGNPINLNADSDIDNLESRIYRVPTGGLAEELGLPERQPGMLEVMSVGATSLRSQRFTTNRGNVWSRGTDANGDYVYDWILPVNSEQVQRIVAAETDDVDLEEGQMLMVYEPLLEEYTDDFTGGQDYQPRQGWTPRWETSALTEWFTRSDIIGSNGGALVVRKEQSSAARIAVTWDEPPHLKNLEVLFCGRHAGTFTQMRSGAVMRLSGTEGAETGIVVGHWIQGGYLTIRAGRYLNGNYRVIFDQSTNVEHTSSDWYWIRARLVGRELQVKAWVDGSSEPSSWTRETTLNANEDLPAGRTGVFMGATSASYWDSFTIIPAS